MNSTRWPTLTDFVKHLGKESLCEVNETEKGWFITYIDRDPEVLARAVRRGVRPCCRRRHEATVTHSNAVGRRGRRRGPHRKQARARSG